MKPFLRIVCIFLLSLLSALSCMSSQAQDAYPNGPITLVVSFPPGGAADLNARILTDPLGAVLKQPIIVQNKPGVGGALGTSYVVKSKPDGYTLSLSLSPVMVHPESEKIYGRKPMYEMNQLEPIALLSSDPMVILVKTDSPFKTLEDLIKAAKANPGKYNYAASGTYGPIHLSVEMLAYQAGVKFTQVNFGGGGPAMLSLLGGQVDFTTTVPAVAAAQIASGKVRPLAVSSAKRIAAFPDLPSYKEAGYDAQFYIWAGIHVPKGTPPAVIQTLRQAVKEAVKTPQYLASAQKQNMILDYRDAPEFEKFAQEDGNRMLVLLKAMGKIE